MVDKMRSTPLKVQRGGRYLKLKRSSPAKRKACHLSSPSQYKGVRMRVWGKWVTEVRDPVTKTRIWLGSFATAEMAARAYDAAVVCLKGPCASEVNFPDSIPSFVIPQCNSSPKEIQAVAHAAATASVPAASPLAMAAPQQTVPSEALPQVAASVDMEMSLHRDVDDCENYGTANWNMPEPECSSMEMLHRDVDDGENGGTANCNMCEPECSSNVENWINKEFEELDAFDGQEALVEPLRRQFSDPEEQLFFPWPMTSEDYEDAADCLMIRDDVQLWSFD